MEKKKFLYIPVETKVRELDAKLLLSIEALDNNYIVIIGSDVFLEKMQKLPKGIILHKDTLKIRENDFKRLKEYQHHIAVHDEEGYVVLDWSYYINTRISPVSMDNVDMFLCWGNKQYNEIVSWNKLYKKEFKTIKVGHPRIDILRDPIRKYNSKSSSEKLILINTHFSACNYIDGEEEVLRMMQKNNELDYDHYVELVKYKKELMNKYIELITFLSTRFVDFLIVIRPHPSENKDTWINITKNLSNVTVTKDKPVGYWINRAKIVIHTGCTTGIETFLMGKVAIAYKPIINKQFDIALPDSVSVQVSNEKECEDIITTVIKNEFDYHKYSRIGRDILSDEIEILDDEFSYQKIIREFNTLDLLHHDFTLINRLKIRFLFLFIFFKSFIKESIKKIINYKSKNSKFELTTSKEIKNTIEKLQPTIYSKFNIKVDKLTKNLFMLSKED